MRIAVVGGGISGLVAAYRLRGLLGPDAEIVVLERGDRLGGILYTGEINGDPVDLGAEAFVGRRPEVIELLSELGLDDQLVRPGGLRPLIWSEGRTHALPARTLMGIPSEAELLRGLVSQATLERVAAEPGLPFTWQPGSDTDVYSLVADRFGAEVAERSVDPLLGGVYAGSSRSIGVRAALPTLAAALDKGASSLTAAVSAALSPPSDAPVFGGLRDGYRVLLEALADRSGAKFVTGEATELTCTATGWRLEPVGAVDAVVLATPAPVTARLLAQEVPVASSLLAGIELSSSAVVALALPRDTQLPQNSGVLVATGEPLSAKAFTLSSRKWPHLAEREIALVRASFGKFGDDAVLGWPDGELVAAAVADLSTVTGVPISPLSATVQRWPGALAQYAPGHTERIAEIESVAAEFDTLAITGAYLHGVGVPACVASATAAAHHVAAALS
ncbi:protoporphyrinogen oxidase [Nocardia cyriacigeorgica]|uniref:protoporphyrinogen oxidase n=1 Tax=Nocardia cyriacigeorgica TaxID=135487 RepID=UPI0018940C32|nr:protoporphyrinogen oxidase [Nocardia cyriacigeorgica]MBF6096986.1 protoporphyrinogen oxidase [Nocardia cyriacigeorgica]MBF6345826.1 protoporphyrinogen oxidase [Nocardia cyriacigeorgica]